MKNKEYATLTDVEEQLLSPKLWWLCNCLCPLHKLVRVATQAMSSSSSDFSQASQLLRTTLLEGSEDIESARRKLKIALRNLDEDGDGQVTTEELRK